MTGHRRRRADDRGSRAGDDGPARVPDGSGGALWLAAAVVVLTAAVYAPVGQYDFVPLDDPLYVSENPHIADGLTWQGVQWALTTGRASNWHPITWLSHMLDVELFGVAAGPHHLVNLILHVVNTLLLFAFLRRWTGAAGRSALVAALFAVHPLHVESVAWVAERKDVLSTFFLMLALHAYARYQVRPSWRPFLPVVALAALGLMAKPMLVTLPLVLVLVDVWPLGRIGATEAGWRRWWLAMREKIPLVALAVCSSVVTIVVQQAAVASLEALPIGRRLAAVPVNYVFYLAKTIWPARLTVLYSQPAVIPLWQSLAAAALLAAVSVAVIRARKRAPYLAVGWFWFLVTLVPVIGIVQVGLQSTADRYTYVPSIGLFVMIAWGVPDLLARWPARRILIPAGATILVVAFAVAARAQVGYWKDGVALWEHAVEVTLGADAYESHRALAVVLGQQGRVAEAAAHLAEGVKLKPDSADARRDLALALGRQGRIDEAIVELREAIRLRPAFAAAHAELGAALTSRKQLTDAIAHLQEAVRLEPALAEAHNNLGFAFAQTGRLEDARRHFGEAVRLRPDMAEAQDNLGSAEAAAGRLDLALPRFAEAVRLAPNFELARQHLAVALAASGRFPEAVAEFNRVLAINPANETARRALAALQSSRPPEQRGPGR